MNVCAFGGMMGFPAIGLPTVSPTHASTVSGLTGQ